MGIIQMDYGTNTSLNTGRYECTVVRWRHAILSVIAAARQCLLACFPSRLPALCQASTLLNQGS